MSCIPPFRKRVSRFRTTSGFHFLFADTIHFPLQLLVRSRFGLMIEGLRSNELRMELLGYDIRKFKLIDASTGLRDRS
jgi:ABC-type branched-subunit amino acid transport system permease subunit